MAYDARVTSDELLAALKQYIRDCASEDEASHLAADHSVHDRESVRPKVLGKSRYLDWAKRIYRIRRSRAKEFPAELFGEPAWDILLDLYIAFLECRKVTVKSACIGADVPTTTALRHLGVLETANLIHRVDDLVDRRVQWVALTQKAIVSISHVCEEDMRAEMGLKAKRKSGASAPDQALLPFITLGPE